MAWWNRTAPAPATEAPMVPAYEVDTLRYEVERLEESLADLRREDVGWAPLTSVTGTLIPREELGRRADKLRAQTIVNPLLRRALAVRVGYVWGDGVTIAAAEQDGTGQDVNAVVQGFVNDERNLAACFSAQAREDAERALFDSGNYFRAHFVNPMTGHVQVRPIPLREITDIITAPGDRYTPHYYLRTWSEEHPGGYGRGTVQRQAYYPDLKHQPYTKPKSIGGVPVLWPGTVGGAAILHAHGRTEGEGSPWGIPDAYAAAPYAIRYEGFLADWLTVVKTLSKFAGQLRDPAGKSQQMRAAAQAIATAPGAGGVLGMNSGEYKPISVSGATINAESGRPVAAMVAAALDLPVTILLADPGVSGARATAETLDPPTYNAMAARQRLWTSAERATMQFVIEQHVIAPRGSLKGTVTNEDDRLTVDLGGDTDDTILITWPEIRETEPAAVLAAAAEADALGVIPKTALATLVLHALGLDNVADLIDQMTDDDGQWVGPDDGTEALDGAAAAAQARAGRAPAPVPDDE